MLRLELLAAGQCARVPGPAGPLKILYKSENTDPQSILGKVQSLSYF